MRTLIEQFRSSPVANVTIYVAEALGDARRFEQTLRGYTDWLALDTESTSFRGMYRPDWRLRLVQFGTMSEAWVIPAEYAAPIKGIIAQPRQYVLHNAPHDALALDLGFSYESNVLARSIDTYIMCHLLDSRPAHEGGIGLGVKDAGTALLGDDCGRWERALKARFKALRVPIPGEVYKSANKRLGRKAGDPKFRAPTMTEGWSVIDTYDEAYLRYSGMDAIIEACLYQELSRRLPAEYVTLG